MIKVRGIGQRSEAWYKIKMKTISSSNFGKIITPSGKLSSQCEDYLIEIAYYDVNREIPDNFITADMQRGIDLEEEAISYYSLMTNNDVDLIGFIYLNEAKNIGCSPDGLIKKLGSGIEVKCPNNINHAKTVIKQEVPNQYIPQIQGLMWICEADSWEFISYSKAMVPFIMTIKRDDEYIKKLSDAVLSAEQRLITIKSKLKGMMNGQH
jgi:hypothetical protein